MKEEYKKLGNMKFAEGAVLTVFIMLVLLWFTREPGFVDGWATVLFNKDDVWVCHSLTRDMCFMGVVMAINTTACNTFFPLYLQWRHMLPNEIKPHPPTHWHFFSFFLLNPPKKGSTTSQIWTKTFSMIPQWCASSLKMSFYKYLQNLCFVREFVVSFFIKISWSQICVDLINTMDAQSEINKQLFPYVCLSGMYLMAL